MWELIKIIFKLCCHINVVSAHEYTHTTNVGFVLLTGKKKNLKSTRQLSFRGAAVYLCCS